MPQTGRCGDAVHPCAPVGTSGMLGRAGPGMVWVQWLALCIHCGDIHHSNGGDQPEPWRAERRPGAFGDGEALSLFPQEDPAPCDAALHPPLFLLRTGNRHGRRVETGGDGRGPHHEQWDRRRHHHREAEYPARRDHRVGIPAGGRMLYYTEAGVPASVQERGSPMLRLSGLCKRFEDLPVLSNLSLTLSRGEIVALIGPSGCGKTTLLNIISGLTAPDAGTVEGADGRLSYMFQSARLLPWCTVEENIRLVREDAPAEEVRSLITAVGLEGFERYYPGQLSGGMARRCALARAFHFGGEIFLMDEPFQGLDYGIRMEMLSMLLSIWQREGPGRIRVSFKTVQGSVSWDTCYTPCGMCPAFNYTSITYPC